MRKSRVLLAGVAVAAAAAGTSAFTNSNTFSPDNNVAGYGAMTASGVTVSNVHYDTPTDVSKIHDVVFTVDKDTASMTDVMTLTSGVATTTPVTGSASTCVAATTAGPVYTITCTLTTDLDITAFDNTALTVTSN